MTMEKSQAPVPLVDSGALRHHALTRETAAGELASELASLRSVPLKKYRAFSAAAMSDFDARRRKVAFAPALAGVPHIEAIARSVEEQLLRAVHGRRTTVGGVVVAGQGGVGKSTALAEVAQRVWARVQAERFGESWREEEPTRLRLVTVTHDGHKLESLSVPVLYLNCVAGMGPKVMLALMIASYGSVGLPVGAFDRRVRGVDLAEQLARIAAACGTVLIVIDEIHFIRDTWSGVEAINYLKDLMNRTSCVFLIAGVPDTRKQLRLLDGDLRLEVRDQLRRRFVRHDIAPLANPALNDDLRDLMEVLSWKCVLLKQDPESMTSPEILQYVHRRTGGVIEHVVRLVEGAALRAIGGGEQVSIELMDTVEISVAADASMVTTAPTMRRQPLPGHLAKRAGEIADSVNRRHRRPGATE